MSRVSGAFSAGRGECPSKCAAIELIALKIGCAPQTLHEWVRKHEVDSGVRGGTTSAEHDRNKELERDNKELRRANAILKVAGAFFAQAELDLRLKSGCVQDFVYCAQGVRSLTKKRVPPCNQRVITTSQKSLPSP